MKRRRTRIWLGFLVMATGAAMLLWQRPAAPIESSFETADVERRTLSRSVVATGVLRPQVGAEVRVGSRVSGTVVELAVAVGDRVEPGDLLARLDPAAFEARDTQARAAIDLARAELARIKSEVGRRESLTQAGVIPAVRWEEAQRDLEVARARLTSAEAAWRASAIDVESTRITAPLAGVVAEISTREGETVAASFAAPTFATIIDLERLEVRAYVDEIDIGRVFVGQSATFRVDTYPEVEIEAQVIAIRPKPELANGVVNYLVILAFGEVEGLVLRPEMSAHVELATGQRPDALTVPPAALRRQDGSRFVTVQRAGEWVDQEVTIGWRNATSVEISSGLEVGETVRLNPS